MELRSDNTRRPEMKTLRRNETKRTGLPRSEAENLNATFCGARVCVFFMMVPNLYTTAPRGVPSDPRHATEVLYSPFPRRLGSDPDPTPAGPSRPSRTSLLSLATPAAMSHPLPPRPHTQFAPSGHTMAPIGRPTTAPASQARLAERLGPHDHADGSYQAPPSQPSVPVDRPVINHVGQLQAKLFVELVENPPDMSFHNTTEWASWSNRLFSALVSPDSRMRLASADSVW